MGSGLLRDVAGEVEMIDKTPIDLGAIRNAARYGKSKTQKHLDAPLVAGEDHGDHHSKPRTFGSFNSVADRFLSEPATSMLAGKIIADFACFAERAATSPVCRQGNVPDDLSIDGFYKHRKWGLMR